MPSLLLLRVLGTSSVALLLISTWPQSLALQRVHVFAQLTALRGPLILIAVACASLFGVLAWRAATLRRFCLAMVVAFLAVAVLDGAVMGSRGFGRGSAASRGATDLTVFSWNTFGDAPDARRVAEFALEYDVGVLALAETTRSMAQEIANIMGENGRSMQVFAVAFDENVKARSTALLVAASLGEYEIDATVGSTSRVPSIVARPIDGIGPTLISAHAAPPLPGMLRTWASGLAWLAERCRGGDVIVAGDLNATLDHFAGLRDGHADLGACRDGANVMGSAALGTWPSQVPTILGSPIDHVLATPEWEFASFRVVAELDAKGSDHRALLATLRRKR